MKADIVTSSSNGKLARVRLTDEEFKHQLLETLLAIRDGNFEARMSTKWSDIDARIAETLNQICARHQRFNTDLLRLRRRVGEEGRINERMSAGDAVGHWADRVEAINALVDELSQPTVEMGRVIGAVAKGDLQQAMPLEVGGRPLRGE